VVIRPKRSRLTLTGEIMKIAGASTPTILGSVHPRSMLRDIDGRGRRALTPGMTVQVEIVVDKVETCFSCGRGRV
jgi:hypothetical protein